MRITIKTLKRITIKSLMKIIIKTLMEITIKTLMKHHQHCGGLSVLEETDDAVVDSPNCEHNSNCDDCCLRK